jgi:succinate dehydrogenase/fumarate reductase flavoprotein subunit
MSSTMHKTIEAGILIIGGGGSGCRAAIEAHDQGADVLMIVKGELGNSGCTLNVGTSAAVGEWGDPNDTTFSAMEDLLEHGGYLGNQDLAKVLAEEAPDRVRELAEWGIEFERDEDGSITVDEDAAHSFARNLYFKPAKPRHHDYGSLPGMAMMDVLMEQLEARKIRVMNDVVLVDLLTNNGRVVGATAIDCNTNEFVVIKASANDCLRAGDGGRPGSRVQGWRRVDGHGEHAVRAYVSRLPAGICFPQRKGREVSGEVRR